IASLSKRTPLLLLRFAYGRGTHATPHVAGREVPDHLAVIGASNDLPPASLVGLFHADLTHAARLLFGFLGEGRSRQERGLNRRSGCRNNKLSHHVHQSPLCEGPDHVARLAGMPPLRKIFIIGQGDRTTAYAVSFSRFAPC